MEKGRSLFQKAKERLIGKTIIVTREQFESVYQSLQLANFGRLVGDMMVDKLDPEQDSNVLYLVDPLYTLRNKELVRAQAILDSIGLSDLFEIRKDETGEIWPHVKPQYIKTPVIEIFENGQDKPPTHLKFRYKPQL